MSLKDIKWEDYFYYDPESYTFLKWKVDRVGNKVKDKPAGWKTKSGYYEVKIHRRIVKVHRIIYELFYGAIEKDYYIDHIDQNKTNNAINNLRSVERNINLRNMPKRKDNTSGVTGVCYFINTKSKTPYWMAYWSDSNGKKSKYFSVKKYGDSAFDMAVEFRKNRILELNSMGFGYSEGHGV